MKLTPLILLFPILLSAQFDNEKYGYVASEIDPRNTFFQGVKNTEGYNGTLKLGYKAQSFQIEAFGEIYPNINYVSVGLNVNYVFRNEVPLRPLIGIQLSTIDRPTKLVPSLGVNAGLEYHFGSFFLSLRLEGKLREDLRAFDERKDRLKPYYKYMMPSGYAGVGVKFN